MDMWAEELRHVELSSDVGRAEQCLQMHSDAALHVQNCIIEVMQVGQDLLPVSNVLFVVCRDSFLQSVELAVSLSCFNLVVIRLHHMHSIDAAYCY